MCSRMLLGIKKATFQGKHLHTISVDARCMPQPEEVTADPVTDKKVIMFKNSDKSGVIVFVDDIETMEFTNVVPESALIVEYVEPDQAPDTAGQQTTDTAEAA